MKKNLMQELQRVDSQEYWITGSGDLLKFSELDEQHAKNIYSMLKKYKIEIPNTLLDRIEYFNRQRSQVVDLF